MLKFTPALIALALAACADTAPDTYADTTTPTEEGWVSIFDGQTLDGWTPMIRYHPLGENFGQTWRVEDGKIVVSYDQYGDDFGERFGHLYYDTPYTAYRLRMDYRFVGEQMPGGPDWGRLNAGVLFHTQPPETIPEDQDFPISLEAQFLGEGAHAPTTGNLCTPGTSALVNGDRPEEHCTLSDYAAPPLGEWVTFELEVTPPDADGIQTYRHYTNGEMVFEYSDASLDEAHPWAETRALTHGYFAIQSESHPVEYRNIELKVLEE